MAQTSSFDNVADAVSRLCDGLRLYAEVRIAAMALFPVDLEQAVDDLDRAFDGLLLGLHSLYDAMQQVSVGPDWYRQGDTAACVIVRNARHHNAGLFESWNRRMLKRNGLKEFAGASFLMATFDCFEPDAPVAEYYVPWDDFRRRLDMPESRIKNPSAIASLLDRDCAFATIRQHASTHGYPANQVYLNLIPIVMNAVSRVFGSLPARAIDPSDFDTRVYVGHFGQGPLANLNRPTFKTIVAPT